MDVIVVRLLCCRYRVLRHRSLPLRLAKKAAMAIRSGAHSCPCCGIGLLPWPALSGASGGGTRTVLGGEDCLVRATGAFCLGAQDGRPLAARRHVPDVAPAHD